MKNKSLFLYITSIYVISTIISFLWLGFTDMSYLHGTDGYAIITPDGYYYLKTIDKIINNIPIDEFSVFCYLFAIPLKLLGVESAKNILFFVPPFFAGAFGVGAYLFSREFLQDKYAFLSSLLAASSIGFVVRLKAGYFDTDIFVFTLPIFIMAFGLRYLRNGEQRELILAVAPALFLSIIYNNGAILTLFCAAGFVLLLFITANKKHIKKLSILLFASTFINPLYILGTASKAKLYLFKDEQQGLLDLTYSSNFGFISESSSMPLANATALISGNMFFFALSVIGLILLIREKREIVAILPLFLLGSMAFILGSRFAPFASVAAATGIIFLGTKIASMLQKKYLAYTAIALVFIPGFTINILNASLNNEIGGFHAKEVSSLKNIEKLIEKNSTVFSRWDYGYELAYYLEAFTPSSNGFMGGAQIFVESAAVSFSNQDFVANIMLEADTELRRIIPKNEKPKTLFLKMAKQKGFTAKEIKNYVKYLETANPKSEKNTYLLLPTKMIDIFETIQKNANTEFMDGYINKSPFFKFYRPLFENDKVLKLDKNVFLDKVTKAVSIDGNKTELSTIYVVKKNGSKTDVFANKLSQNSTLSLIFMEDLGGYILSDDKSINTVFVKMLIFDEYDKTRFEKLYDDKYFKLFRVL